METLLHDAGFTPAAITVIVMLLAQWSSTVLSLRRLAKIHSVCPHAIALMQQEQQERK